MWLAMILFCVPYESGCLVMADNRGPYPTEQQCWERVDEMLPNARQFWFLNGHKAAQLRGRCYKQGDQT